MADKLQKSCVLLVVLCMLAGCTAEIDKAPDATLQVMTYNVGNYKHPYPKLPAVAKVIETAGVPDVLLVQDSIVSVPVRKLASQLGLRYFVEGDAAQPAVNAALLSKHPLQRARTLQLDQDDRVGVICADIVYEREITLCSLYLKSISEQAREAVRRRGDQFYELSRLFMHEIFIAERHRASIAKLVAWLGEDGDRPVIIGGDFNTIPLSRAIRDLTQHYDDALWMSGDYWTGTYTKLDFPIKPRIDYLFHSRDITVARARVVPDTAGDHYPVVANFQLPQ